jgi:hypothetical protein
MNLFFELLSVFDVTNKSARYSGIGVSMSFSTTTCAKLTHTAQRRKKKYQKGIQQWVFAGGHPPNYQLTDLK